MKHDDHEDPRLPPRGMRRSRRPNRRKSARARRIVAALDWLDLPLVLRTGSLPAAPCETGVAFEPIERRLGRALPSSTTGLFAVRDEEGRLEATAVDRTLLSESGMVLSRSERFPRALVPLVGDPDEWREGRRRLLRDRNRAFRALCDPDSDVEMALKLLATAFRVGPPDSAPLSGIDPAVAADLLGRIPLDSAGAMAAAVRIGRISPGTPVPSRLGPYRTLGARLRRWPEHLLCRAANGEVARALSALAGQDARLGSHAGASFAAEYLWESGAFPDALTLRAAWESLEAWDAATSDRWWQENVGPDEAEVWLETWLGTAGRIAGRLGSPRAIRHLASWLAAVADRLRRGVIRPHSPRVALLLLERGLRRAKEDRERIAGLLRGFDRHATALLFRNDRASADVSDTGTLCERLHPAVDLLALGIEVGGPVLDHVLTYCKRHELAAFVSGRREDLEETLSLASGTDRIDRAQIRGTWSFLRLRPKSIANAALRAWTAAADRDGFGWADADVLATDIEKFLDEGGPGPERRRFLLRNAWLLERLVEAVVTAWQAHERPRDRREFVWRRNWILEIALAWRERGNSDLRRLVKHLFREVERFERRRDPTQRSWMWLASDHIRVAVDLAQGDPGALTLLLNHTSGSWGDRWGDAKRALDYLGDRPELATFLRSLAGDGETLPALLAVLGRIARALRLRREDELARLEDDLVVRPLPPAPPGSDALPPELAKSLRLLLALTGRPLPSALRRILDRPRRLAGERNALRRRAREGRAAPSTARRLEKLERILEKPEELRAGIERDLSAAVAKRLRRARLDRLGRRIDEILDGYWAEVLGPGRGRLDHPDGENALLLSLEIRSNRRILRRLLRAVAEGRDFVAEHPGNRVFLDRLAASGCRPDRFRAMHQRQLVVRDEELHVYTEQDPLRVLQMGNLFGTCLARGEMNDFSAVANAVEANKRVLYVENRRGQVVARRLLAVDGDGVLYCFRTYGDDDDPWPGILTELLTVDLLRSSGLRLPTRRELRRVNRENGKHLELFAEWYYDGVVPLDWWAAADLESGGDPVEALRLHLGSRPRSDEVDVPTARAILRLGRDAVPVLDPALRAGRLRPEEAVWIARWTNCPEVRERLAR